MLLRSWCSLWWHRLSSILLFLLLLSNGLQDLLLFPLQHLLPYNIGVDTDRRVQCLLANREEIVVLQRDYLLETLLAIFILLVNNLLWLPDIQFGVTVTITGTKHLLEQIFGGQYRRQACEQPYYLWR
ncbi:hypothetical protein AAHE18_02G069300 [Arachis hypogaea]|nr:uncharacterized protein DS421_2g43190 [Arachis hypogaea]